MVELQVELYSQVRCAFRKGSRRVMRSGCSRRSNDDLSVNEFLIKLRILAFLVRRCDQGVALILKPFTNAQLVLRGTKKLRDLFSVLLAIVEDEKDFGL